MKKKGVIKLYALADDSLLSEHRYFWEAYRKIILDFWKKKYMSNFNNCYINIIPNADISKVSKDGTNHVVDMPKWKTKKPEPIVTKIIRSKAIYSNHSPYGIADELK